jgi:hypothetical protein
MMADITQLSRACTEALRDAEAHGAKVAAHFLRCQAPELFREIRHRKHDCTGCEFAPIDTDPPTAGHPHG